MSGTAVDDEIVEQFEDCVWMSPGVDFLTAACTMQAELQRRRLDVRQILARQPPETLVLAFQKAFFAAEAFTELYRRHWQQVCRWMVQFGAEANEAFDLAQSLFFNFYRRGLRGYDPTQPFGSYLWVAAHHLFVAAMRRRRPEPAAHLDDRAGAGSAEDEVVHRELEDRVNAALRRLPAEQRQIMELTLQGQKPADIALLLSAAPRRVFRQLWLARNTLAEALRIERPPTNRGRKPRQERTGPESPNS